MDVPAIKPPEKRRLRVYAFDPLASQDANALLGSGSANEVVLEVEHEPLEVGPVGRRVAVIDYDATRDCYYPPVDLDDRWLLARDGLAPAEDDPRFHQQMAYAVTMKTIENFDRALGRKIRFTNRRTGPFKDLGPRLAILPHAFEQQNAFFDPTAGAVMFGYFTADAKSGSAFVPGQTVFTALSSDILAHEVTHGLIHRLRPRFMEETNEDVGAFHEGFSDIVAIFQHFTYPGLLRRVIERTGGVLDGPGALIDLAQQFGHGAGDGAALRTAIAEAKPHMYQKLHEVHDRGALLVAAVFDAFFQAYRERTSDLVPRNPEARALITRAIVERLAQAAEACAQQFLLMCIRAFEYLPPCDLRYGDFLRAAITADIETHGDATRRHRELLIDGFRRRGIYPDDAFSLSESSLRWPEARAGRGVPPLPNAIVEEAVLVAHHIQRPSKSADKARGYGASLHGYAKAYPEPLGLLPEVPVSVEGFHTSFHVGPNGQLNVEIVARFEQNLELDDGAIVRGGSTVIAAADGKIRYVIAKPLPGVADATMKRSAADREERRRAFAARIDHHDAMAPWLPEGEGAKKLDFARLHALAGGRR